MSRLGTLSPAAINAMFSVESDDTLITLLTFKENAAIGLSADIRLADNYTGRLSETGQDIVYGLTSNGLQYMFLPVEIILPSDDAAGAPQCGLTIHDVTRILLPQIRSLSGPPSVDIQIVLKSTPNVVEMSYAGFKMTNVTYNANTISCSLTIPSLEREPFPAHSFTPAYFPGLF